LVVLLFSPYELTETLNFSLPLIKFVVFLLFLYETSAIFCKYSVSTTDYTCDIFESTITEENDDVEFEGLHLSGKTDDDVTFVTTSRSSIKFLPSAILKKFKNTKTLLLHNSGVLKVSPKAFESCDELLTLILMQNQVENLPDSVFLPCMKLKAILIYDGVMTTITDKTFEGLSRSLESLTVNSHKIATIHPDAFRHLNMLKTIDIGENLLTELNKKWLENLPQLENIAIYRNKFSAVDFEFLKSFKNLKSLNLQGSKFTSFPVDAFHTMTNLEKLNVADMGWKGIQTGMFKHESLAKLKELDLYKNQIGSLEPGTFTSLVGLETLDLSNNNLTRLNSDSFTRFESLKSFGIQSNQIDEIQPNLFENFPKLKTVWSKGNVCIKTEVMLPENYTSNDLKAFEDCFKYWVSPRPAPTTDGVGLAAISVQLLIVVGLAQVLVY
jgi:Leucine-rich repeat (LRR) protein